MVKFIDSNVLETMETLAIEGNREILERWLKDCEYEIKFRQDNKLEIFPLQYEKEYLKYLLG